MSKKLTKNQGNEACVILDGGEFVPTGDLQVFDEIKFDKVCRRSLTIKGIFCLKEKKVKQGNSKSN